MIIIILSLSWCFLMNFRKKLLCLIVLEFFMLTFIMIFFCFCSFILSFSLFCVSLIMVLDSTFGLSCLMSSSRNSSVNSSMFNLF